MKFSNAERLLVLEIEFEEELKRRKVSENVYIYYSDLKMTSID
jgi:hypothetical protein